MITSLLLFQRRPGAVKEKLARDKAQALFSKELATIDRNVPVDLELEKTVLHDFDRDKIVKLFGELNFYSLVTRLPADRFETTNEFESTNRRVGSAGVKDFKYEILGESESEITFV
jgi:DNA polymerase-1